VEIKFIGEIRFQIQDVTKMVDLFFNKKLVMFIKFRIEKFKTKIPIAKTIHFLASRSMMAKQFSSVFPMI